MAFAVKTCGGLPLARRRRSPIGLSLSARRRVVGLVVGIAVPEPTPPELIAGWYGYADGSYVAPKGRDSLASAQPSLSRADKLDEVAIRILNRHQPCSGAHLRRRFPQGWNTSFLT